ncbi:Ku protein [Streptomyces griseoluteus]|uniref:Ku protein n=1 Tax=Streptomyces griseoluteus TaxID=29306 RepID=UPI00343FCF83
MESLSPDRWAAGARPTLERLGAAAEVAHAPDGYRKVCELENREVHGAEAGRAYEMPDGRLVPVTDQDLRDLPLPTARAIEIVAFLPTSAVDPIRLGGAGYYLAADGGVAAKPYTSLREALARSTRVAVARFSCIEAKQQDRPAPEAPAAAP